MSKDNPSPAAVRDRVMAQVAWAYKFSSSDYVYREPWSIAHRLGIPARRVSRAITTLVAGGDLEYAQDRWGNRHVVWGRNHRREDAS